MSNFSLRNFHPLQHQDTVSVLHDDKPSEWNVPFETSREFLVSPNKGFDEIIGLEDQTVSIPIDYGFEIEKENHKVMERERELQQKILEKELSKKHEYFDRDSQQGLHNDDVNGLLKEEKKKLEHYKHKYNFEIDDGSFIEHHFTQHEIPDYVRTPLKIIEHQHQEHEIYNSKSPHQVIESKFLPWEDSKFILNDDDDDVTRSDVVFPQKVIYPIKESLSVISQDFNVQKPKSINSSSNNRKLDNQNQKNKQKTTARQESNGRNTLKKTTNNNNLINIEELFPKQRNNSNNSSSSSSTNGKNNFNGQKKRFQNYRLNRHKNFNIKELENLEREIIQNSKFNISQLFLRRQKREAEFSTMIKKNRDGETFSELTLNTQISNSGNLHDGDNYGNVEFHSHATDKNNDIQLSSRIRNSEVFAPRRTENIFATDDDYLILDVQNSEKQPHKNKRPTNSNNHNAGLSQSVSNHHHHHNRPGNNNNQINKPHQRPQNSHFTNEGNSNSYNSQNFKPNHHQQNNFHSHQNSQGPNYFSNSNSYHESSRPYNPSNTNLNLGSGYNPSGSSFSHQETINLERPHHHSGFNKEEKFNDKIPLGTLNQNFQSGTVTQHPIKYNFNEESNYRPLTTSGVTSFGQQPFVHQNSFGPLREENFNFHRESFNLKLPGTSILPNEGFKEFHKHSSFNKEIMIGQQSSQYPVYENFDQSKSPEKDGHVGIDNVGKFYNLKEISHFQEELPGESFNKPERHEHVQNGNLNNYENQYNDENNKYRPNENGKPTGNVSHIQITGIPNGNTKPSRQQPNHSHGDLMSSNGKPSKKEPTHFENNSKKPDRNTTPATPTEDSWNWPDETENDYPSSKPTSNYTENVNENQFSNDTNKSNRTYGKNFNRHPNIKLIPVDSCGVDLGNKILGGTNAQLDEFPWMALLQHTSESGNSLGFGCGGSLISSKYVLTAAHCIKGPSIKNNIKVTKVRLGEFDLSKDKDCQGEICSQTPVDAAVDNIIVHPKYRSTDRAQRNDIALIRLRDDVKNSPYVSPICLPLNGSPKNITGEKLTTAGWGKTSNGQGSKSSKIKQKVILPGVNLEECSKFYRKLNIDLLDTQMCAGGEKGKDSCQGDSGGPLMKSTIIDNQVRWQVQGVVSFGPESCGEKNVAGVYTKVSEYIEWILDNMKP